MSLLAKTYLDLDLDFDKHPVTGDILKKKDIQAIIGAIKTLLYTNYYERPFQPNIGSNIRRMLFEPLDNISATSIQDEILRVIRDYEPRVKIEGIAVTPDYDRAAYSVDITMFLVSDAEPISVRFFLERVR